MFSTVQRWGIKVLLPAATFMLVLSAEQARAQGRLQTRQSARCQPNGGQAQLNSQQQLNVLRNALQNELQQLNALGQNGQLTSAQQLAVAQLQSTLQNALQQVSALQNGGLTSSQLQMLGPQQSARALQLRAAPMLGRR